MMSRQRAIVVSLIGLWTLGMAAAGCATMGRRPVARGVPIEQRPTPPQPPDSALAQRDTTRAEDRVPVNSTPVVSATPIPNNSPSSREPSATPTPPVQTIMSAEERKASLARIVADTTAASAAVRRCEGKTLLPDQESVFETTRSYLVQTRAAITRGELWSAEGLARKARQLALSLDCR